MSGIEENNLLKLNIMHDNELKKIVTNIIIMVSHQNKDVGFNLSPTAFLEEAEGNATMKRVLLCDQFMRKHGAALKTLLKFVGGIDKNYTKMIDNIFPALEQIPLEPKQETKQE